MDWKVAVQTLAEFYLAEVITPESWHWVVDEKKGWFLHKHHPVFAEVKHISAVRETLRPEQKILLDEALSFVATEWERSTHDVLRNASNAIRLLLRGKEESKKAGNSFNTPMIPLDEYTQMSDETLVLPAAVDFSLSQGSVLQSAREAVQFRMETGKSDLNYYYSTRTVAIYFKEDGKYFVAFDDNPFENILLSRAQEGCESHRSKDSWVVSTNDPLVRSAILRAKKSNRVIEVASSSERSDALAASTCIIGDISEKYNKWLQKQGYNGTKVWNLTTSNCQGKLVNERQAEIRLLGVGIFTDLDADWQCDGGSWARGAQKFFSSGNKGLVPYIGVLLFKQLNLYHDDAEVIAFFDPLEKIMNRIGQRRFYELLSALRKSIRSTNDILQVMNFNKIYGHHREWLERPILLRYAFETFLHNHKDGLLDRLKSRRETKFKKAFLRHAYEQQFHDTITDEELDVLPSGTLLAMIEDEDITPEDIARARNAIKNNKKGQQFPLNKTYYEQSARGVKIEKMNLDLVKQAVLDIISVTATSTNRWQERHSQAQERIAQLLNNKQKTNDLKNFFSSCINQGNYFKDLSNHHKKMQGNADKNDTIAAINAIRNTAERNKYDNINNEQYQSKMEPLNDIITMLKSQTDNTATEITGVVIKTQNPSITDIEGYDTVHCCALFDYNNQDGAIGYLEDNDIILLQYYTKGKRGLLNIYGIIICARCEDQQGNTVLLVDSAEGDENYLTIIKNWQQTYHNVIKTLAKDTNATGIFYANNAGNTTPKEFLKHIKKQPTIQPHIIPDNEENTEKEETPNNNHPEGLHLQKKNNTPRYLETFNNSTSGNASGYYEKI